MRESKIERYRERERERKREREKDRQRRKHTDREIEKRIRNIKVDIYLQGCSKFNLATRNIHEDGERERKVR